MSDIGIEKRDHDCVRLIYEHSGYTFYTTWRPQEDWDIIVEAGLDESEKEFINLYNTAKDKFSHIISRLEKEYKKYSGKVNKILSEKTNEEKDN